MGIEDPAQVEEKIEQWKQHIKKLEANYLQTSNSIISPATSTNEQALVERQRKFTADIGNRIVNLQSIEQDITSEINEILHHPHLSLLGERAY